MKKLLKSTSGVTLLEVLLVLVIASLILVMSIRYYQTASQNAKVNAGMETLTGVMASVDSYLVAGNALAAMTATTLGPFMPNGAAPNNPWTGAPITVTGTAANYTVGFANVPTAACTALNNLALQNNKITGTCTTYTIVP